MAPKVATVDRSSSATINAHVGVVEEEGNIKVRLSNQFGELGGKPEYVRVDGV